MAQEPTPDHQPLSTDEAGAKAALLAECDTLAAAGVTFVAVHFDGYGDSGTTEELQCYDSDWYCWGEHEPIHYDASYLQNYFELLVPLGLRMIAAGLGMWCSMWPLARSQSSGMIVLKITRPQPTRYSHGAPH